MRTRFLCDIPNARLIRNKLDKGKGQEVEYVIERNIYLGKDDFIYFREHLLEPNPNIIKYKNEMFIDNKGIWHAEIQLQLYKICELEDKFTKDFSKEERKLYLDLDLEKGQLHNLEIDHVIEITYKICKELLK